MLDCAGNADGKIDFRGNDLAGLADLIIIGDIARIDGRAACTDTRAQLVRKRRDDFLEGFCILQGAATGYDNLGAGQLGSIAFSDFFADEAGCARITGPETVSTVPEPPSGAALSKAVPRTVMTNLSSVLSTVAMALPA